MSSSLHHLLRPGLSVYFEKEILGIYGNWMTIDSIMGNQLYGRTEGKNPIEISISIDSVLRVCGDLHWNIQHLLASCSKTLLSEKKIGYFINQMLERPDHFGRVFYAQSEIEMDKSQIPLEEVPLYVIVAMDRRIEGLLEKCCYFGCVLQDGQYKMLRQSDIQHRNRAVFPSSIEIDL